MKRPFDMDAVAAELGAERRGKVSAAGGHFGAMQLLADIESRFRVPSSENSVKGFERPRRRARR